MKKRITLLAFALLMVNANQAQIYITPDLENDRESEEINGLYGNIIYHGLDADQPNWVPTGSGILLVYLVEPTCLIGRKINK